jgi:hypothetical protein
MSRRDRVIAWTLGTGTFQKFIRTLGELVFVHVQVYCYILESQISVQRYRQARQQGESRSEITRKCRRRSSYHGSGEVDEQRSSEQIGPNEERNPWKRTVKSVR